jgi:hypothetical protein
MNIGFYALFILSILMAIAAFTITFFLDFNEQAFTKHNLYFIAAIITVSIFIAAITYRRQGILTEFTIITIAAASLWLYASPNITTINRQSIKPLITTLQQKLKPEDEVICYGNYYQDLPFYLKRIVSVTNYNGEIMFGTKHQDASSWMIDQKTFWERWNSDRVTYLITNESDYRIIQPIAPDRMRIIARLWDTVLVENTK